MRIFLFIVLTLLSFTSVASEYTSFEKNYMKDWIKTYNPKVKEEDLNSIINNAIYYSNKKHLDTISVMSVIGYESNYNKKAKSKHGAIGLTQVKPKYHLSKIKGRNLYNIKVAIDVGTDVLIECGAKNKISNKALKCYTGYTKLNQKKYNKEINKRYSHYYTLVKSNNIKLANKYNGNTRLAYSRIIYD